MAKNDKRFRKNIHIFILALSIYGVIVSGIVLIYAGESNFKTTVTGDIKPIDYFTNDTTLPAEWENPNASKMFDVQVVVLSNIQTDTSYPQHLFVLPGQQAKIYRDFAVFIFANQRATYIVKMDNQTYTSGAMFWMKRITMRSDYSKLNLQVLVANETGVERNFEFTDIRLVDSPWQATDDGNGGNESKIPDIIKPYLALSEGEFTAFVLKRVVADVLSVVAAIFIGIQLATMKADLRGVGRMF